MHLETLQVFHARCRCDERALISCVAAFVNGKIPVESEVVRCDVAEFGTVSSQKPIPFAHAELFDIRK
jgi:hypothetical protein